MLRAIGLEQRKIFFYKIICLKWSGQNAGRILINVIENNIFGKKIVFKLQTKSAQELKDSVRKAWDATDPNKFEDHVKSMP